MIDIEYYSPDEICRDIKKFEDELVDIATRTLWNHGNASVMDVVQDCYIQSCEVFLNSVMEFADFKKGVIQICDEIAFDYYYKERKNVSRPIGTFDEAASWNAKGDSWLWERIEDNTGNPQIKMETIEAISEIKEYKGKWLSYENAKEFVHSLQIKSKEEWDGLCNKNILKNIPTNPDIIYGNKFSWDDFLGIKFYNYQECFNWVTNNIKLNDEKEWSEVVNKLPRYIPANPEEYYKESGWISWDSFLCLYEKKEWETIYLPYKEAIAWIHDNLTLYRLTEKLWGEYVNGLIKDAPSIPDNIPPNPHEVYKNKGWVNYYTWLGAYKYYSKVYAPSYNSAYLWVKKNIPYIKTKEEWDKFTNGGYPLKKPKTIPPNPDVVYRNIGWKGWFAFLNQSRLRTLDEKENIFHSKAIRVIYNKEKIWVKPISYFGDMISGEVITVFCKAKAGTVIQFNASSILSFSLKKESKKTTQSILKEKYRILI